jgi:anti-sigma B factor antagonist
MSEGPTPPLITIEKVDNAIIARVAIKFLEEKYVQELNQRIEDAAGDRSISRVVIDLSMVQILPSMALGSLVEISRNCATRGQALKLAAASAKLRQVFAITRLDRAFTLVDSVEAALA